MQRRGLLRNSVLPFDTGDLLPDGQDIAPVRHQAMAEAA
ncbi:hypothetical protein K530_48715 [Streptomyces noursei CCRC 11814]|nr:hypothetical protein K530_48715 [Streptomyces noursei CCRC 11814]